MLAVPRPEMVSESTLAGAGLRPRLDGRLDFLRCSGLLLALACGGWLARTPLRRRFVEAVVVDGYVGLDLLKVEFLFLRAALGA